MLMKKKVWENEKLLNEKILVSICCEDIQNLTESSDFV